ncbi:MAG: DUF1565 domain-containing protein [Planctomycetota bacterium]|nr:DUF1565 domain-containing protein [Planctomycetota bacterium]
MFRLLAAALLPLVTAACGGGGGGPDDDPGNQLLADLYVDAQTGSDANDGSTLTPFKTITHAMTQATSGMKVKVRPGFYDLGNGESFPIVVPENVQLIGDIDNRGKGATPTMIIGGGLIPNAIEPDSVTVMRPQAGAIIAGFIIQNPHAGGTTRYSGVLVAQPNVQVLANTIQFNQTTGVRYLLGAMGGHLVSNVIEENTQGVFFKEGGLLVRVQDNAIKDNTAGIIIWEENIDLGGGLAASTGNNLIAFNSQADLLIMGQVHVMAQNNRWNHVPPTVHTAASNPPPGVDIWNLNGGGTYDVSGAKLPQIIISQVPNLPFVPLGP